MKRTREGPPASPRSVAVEDPRLRRRARSPGAGLAALAGAALAVLAAGAGAAFGDSPSLGGALALVAVAALPPLAFFVFATRARANLDSASREKSALLLELETVRHASDGLRSLAYYDGLTGLPNRTLLYDRLEVALTHARRQGRRLALLFLDLDGFKAVNDHLGHASGDRLLAELALRLRGSVRAGDTVARIGGDEFVAVLDSVAGAEDADRVAAKILAAVRAPFRLAGHDVSLTASVGSSVFPEDGAFPDELLSSADAAMYRAKLEAGRQSSSPSLAPSLSPRLE